jgi:hypothetical protein
MVDKLRIVILRAVIRCMRKLKTEGIEKLLRIRTCEVGIKCKGSREELKIEGLIAMKKVPSKSRRLLLLSIERVA